MTNDDSRNEGLLWTLKRMTRDGSGNAFRVFLSLIAGCVLTAIACGGSWLFASLTPINDARYGGTYIRVSDGNLAASFSACGIVWIILLQWIWRGTRGRVSVVRPLVSTAMIAIAVTLACVALDELVRREEEYLMTAACFVGGAVALLIWMRFVERWLKGKAIVNDENQINVACPQCGYSLIGLYDLRCPECGTSFTIDALIRAQGYSKTASQESGIRRAIIGDQSTGNEIESVPALDDSPPAVSSSASARNARMT